MDADPDKNPGCKDRSTRLFQKLNNSCNYNIKEKMDPWLAPIHANMFMLYSKEKIEKMITEDKIEIAPISFLRGRTFVNACVIVDESQNVTKAQMEMILSSVNPHL